MKIALKILLTVLPGFTLSRVYAQTDSSIRMVIATRINNCVYRAILDTNNNIFIERDAERAVQKIKNSELEGEGIAAIEFTDVNADGYKDLVITYNSNVPDRRDLFLFDKQRDGFHHIKDYPDYPGPVKLAQTHLYYSYHRSGCADSDWDSDLFEIVNYKIVKLGNISGQGCGRDEPLGIFIYKIAGHSEKLVKRLPLSETGRYKNGKWGFIAYYWKKNYKNFSGKS